MPIRGPIVPACTPVPGVVPTIATLINRGDGVVTTPQPREILGNSGDGVLFYVKDDGTIVTIGAGGGGPSSTTGQTTVDFGAFPGSYDTSVAVTGQTGILAGSIVRAWLTAKDTADHSADEHVVEQIGIVAGNIVPGTGFTIYAKSLCGLAEPTIVSPNPYSIYFVSVTTVNFANNRQGGRVLDRGGTVPRLYGLWTVNWEWN